MLRLQESYETCTGVSFLVNRGVRGAREAIALLVNYILFYANNFRFKFLFQPRS